MYKAKENGTRISQLTIKGIEHWRHNELAIILTYNALLVD